MPPSIKTNHPSQKKSAQKTSPSTPVAAMTSAAASAAAVTTSTTGPAPTPPATQAPIQQPPAASPATPATITGVANTSNRGTKGDLQAAYSALSSGLLSYYQPTDVFALTTGDETCEELVEQFGQFISAAEATKAALSAYRAAVQNERAVALQVKPIRVGVHAILVAKFGRSAPQMLDFGFTPYKVTPKSTEAKAAAVAKNKATRVARGTKGKVQAAAIQGNVVGVVVTPVTATLSTESTGAPAVQASSATPAAPAPSASAVTK